MQQLDFFHSRIDAMINLNEPLAVLVTRLPCHQIKAAVAAKLGHQKAQAKFLKTKTCLAAPIPWLVRVAVTLDVPSCPFA